MRHGNPIPGDPSIDGREMATGLEVTELVEDQRIHLVAGSHGITWDTVFRVGADGETVVMVMQVEALSPEAAA